MSLTPNSFETVSYVEPAPPVPSVAVDPAALGRAVVLGLGGALLGALLYAGFIQLTNIQIGYLSIVIAFLVAKGMMIGSKGRGGIQYQVTAIALTCVAVAAGNALLLYWHVSKEQPIRLSPHNLWVLLRFGVQEPFLEFKDSPGGALLGLFILFVGLRAAWRMTSGDPNAVRHPFSR
jgi:hypothetical protein